MLVHHFIVKLLEACIPEQSVRQEVWDNILLDDLRTAYTNAMNHARFLLEAERDNMLITLNHYFADNLEKARGARRVRELGSIPTIYAHPSNNEPYVPLEALKTFTLHKSNVEQVREEIHDTLQSYYKVARKRFVDSIYQQSINMFLLGKRSPLRILCPKKITELSEAQLELIAGEDSLTRETRQRLQVEIKQLNAAMRILKT